MARLKQLSPHSGNPQLHARVWRRHGIRIGHALLGCLLATILVPSAHATRRLKTDVVYMKNGDKITCEIRSLKQGQLTIKQDYANSTVVLDW